MKSRNVSVRVRPSLKIFSGLPPFIPYLALFFILTLFFMLSSSTVPVQGVHVTLPKSAAPEMVYAVRYMIVTVAPDGKFYFDDKPHENIEKLKRSITEKAPKEKGVSEIIFRCDISTEMDTIIALTELANEQNLTALLMVDRSKPTGKTNFTESE